MIRSPAQFLSRTMPESVERVEPEGSAVVDPIPKGDGRDRRKPFRVLHVHARAPEVVGPHVLACVRPDGAEGGVMIVVAFVEQEEGSSFRVLEEYEAVGELRWDGPERPAGKGSRDRLLGRRDHGAVRKRQVAGIPRDLGMYLRCLC